jgi:CDP-paratose 2-epimerase
MKTVIVTGSAGLVGSEAVRQFAALGYAIVGIDNNFRRYYFGPDGSTLDRLRTQYGDPDYKSPSVRVLQLDVSRREDIEQAFALYGRGAAQPSHDWAASNPHCDFASNALGTLCVLEATRQFCPEAAFVHCSTNKVYGDWPNHEPYEEGRLRLSPIIDSETPDWLSRSGINEECHIDDCTHSLFGCSKLAADLYVQEYGRYFGMNTVCFRGGCLTGPNHAGVEQHGFLSYLCKCAVTGTPYKVIGYGGKQVRDNIHASDLVRAFVEYVNNPTPGAVYNIGGGPDRSCSVLEAIAMAERLSGRKMTVEHVTEPRKGDHRWWITDTRKFEAAYPNWTQEYTLERTMAEIIAAQQERVAA